MDGRNAMQTSDVTAEMVKQFSEWPSLYKSAEQYDFGWWYAYFWKEAKSQLNSRPDDLKEVIVKVVDAAGDNVKSAAAIRAADKDVWAGLRPPLDAPARAFKQKGILDILLRMGFKAMPIANPGGPLGPSAKELFQHKIQVETKGKKIGLAIGYRGVGTTFEDIIKFKGALNRVELKHLNMDKPWHPFSSEYAAKQMYYRLGSNDNCLYTVASAADTIKLAVGFPLIEDEAIHQFSAGKSIETWDAADFAKAKIGTRPVYLARVSCTVNGEAKTGIFLGTESFVYLFKVTQEAVHTEDYLVGIDKKMAGQCQERGVRRVPLSDFLVGLKVRRIHLGSQRTDGTVAFVQEIKYLNSGQWDNLDGVVDPSFTLDRFLGDKTAATGFLDLCRTNYRVGSTILGEREYGAIVEARPVARKLNMGAFANLLGGGGGAQGPNFNIKKTNQSAKIGSTTVRAGVSDKIDVSAILDWDVGEASLTNIKSTTPNLYYGRT
jgi:hypothetical protein